ncbi:hypothetical protein H1R20_g14322, partial [Candolleomyces eurysporus]
MPTKAEKPDASSPDGKLRALTLDGGGFRGLGILYVLDAITKAANARNRDSTDTQLKPHEIFDIIIGSSTGGLIAVLVGRLGLDCATAITEYKALATALFRTSRSAFMETLLADRKLDVAEYDAAVAALVAKYASSETGFYTKPAINADTAVSVMPSAGTKPQLVLSFKSSSHSSWGIQDVIRATTAAPRYLPPYVPLGKKDGKAYTDAAYAGQSINPTIIGKNYWDQNLGILVNIGQWFPAIPLDKQENLTTQDAQPFTSDFLNGAPEDPDVKTEDTVLVYLRQVQMLKKILDDVPKLQSLQPAGVFQRLDPPLSHNNRDLLELVDVFFEEEIKTEVQKWIANNSAQFTQIATKLVKPDDHTPEPNPDVLPYNPALDAKKPKEIMHYLSTYRVIFIIDDSSSMIMNDHHRDWDDSLNNRWGQAQKSIGPIADFTFRNNVSSVDMAFMHYQRNNPFRGIQDSQKVSQIFQQARPPRDQYRIQYTPTGSTLKFYIDEAIGELNSKINNPEEYKKIRPTDIIVLTDGEANEGDHPKPILAAARQEMDRNKHNHNYIGIQFVQIGNSPETELHLADMTKGEYGDMADLVPSNGTDLTPEKLERILLGGIHPTVRRKLRAEDLQ